MVKVKIYGAGSIGNHLAHGCRNKDWEVLICDTDPEALKRTRNEIYPSRYGKWDPSIELVTVKKIPKDYYDIVIVGTPPDTHIDIALHELKGANPPRILMVEKPVCAPSLAGAQEALDLAREVGTFVCVGYNHTLTDNTTKIRDILTKKKIGQPLTITAGFREHWGGIFSAHPWLSGPKDTYLGYWERGGGASGEHSHAINIWQHFANICGVGRIKQISAMMDIINDGDARYDQIVLLNVKTERGFVGSIIQDVITEPAQKSVRIQGTKGFAEWVVNVDDGHDGIRFWDGESEIYEELIPKNRPQDFQGEIDHLASLLNTGGDEKSPIALERGLDTMLVIAAAHESYKHGCSVNINYDRGYSTEALELMK